MLQSMVLKMGLSVPWVLITSTAALAQVTADSTVGTNVSGSNPFLVTGGTQEKTTLFHSFSDFSPGTVDVTFQLDSGQSAVDAVIGRVTGSNSSLIDGQLSLTGGNAPDLFLINPNGITFGQNASLLLTGSFFPSTAESVLFEDNLAFSAVNPVGAPLLSVSTPIGLQMGQQSGAITVENSGHLLTPISGQIAPTFDTGSPLGLRVNPGETLGIIGQSLNLVGGIVAVPGGQTVLGGVESGDVQLISTTQGWQLEFDEVNTFGNVDLSQRALVDGSGVLTSLISIYGHDIQFTDGSFVFISSQGQQPGGNIEVNAANLMQIQGSNANTNLSGVIFSQNLGLGPGADIEVTANQLSLTDAGKFSSATFTPATGGNITVQVANDLEITGVGPTVYSGIDAVTAGVGNGGQLSASARNIQIKDGGLIVASTLRAGDSGELLINASESVSVTGFAPTLALNSGITTASLSPLGGNANQITVNTARLILDDSGSIGASSLGSGDAGNVVINASESISLRNTAEGTFSLVASSIDSSVLAPDPVLQSLLGLPPVPTGNSGNVEITTPYIGIADGAEVAVRNAGVGNAGERLQIVADEIVLNQSGSISAVTQSGNGGNIFLNAENLLSLGNRSILNTEALGSGSGGNITINSPVIVGYNNSDIVANAVVGNGGNINITTQGIFGLKFREVLTDENDITASSEFGVNGTVEINNLASNPAEALAELPDAPADADDQIASACAYDRGNSFIISRRGGLPASPTVSAFEDHPWVDMPNILHSNESQPSADTTDELRQEIEQNVQQSTEQIPETEGANELIESSGWQVNQNGNVELLTAAITPNIQETHTCLAESMD